MHLELGPVPSASALAWLEYAAAVLAHDRVAPTLDDDTPADVTRSLMSFIAEWHEAAERDAEFHWHADVPSEVAEYLVLAFYRIAQQLAEAAAVRGAPLSPPEGQTFYVALVTGLLEALASDGPGGAEFSEHLRSFWPGLDS